MAETEARAPSFESLGLSPEASDGMERIGFPNPPGGLHSRILPRLISGWDMEGTLRHCEHTRKMAAYLVTMFEKFKKHHAAAGGSIRALILTATRCMASRTFECAQKLFSSTDIVVVSLDGGESELEILGDQKPDSVIVTPDTLIHYLSATDGIMPLHTVELLVIDGAYEMLRLGFADHLNQILGQLPELDRQTLFFTTKMTAEVSALAKKVLRSPFFVRPSKTELMIAKISSLALGVQEQPRVEHQQPNNLKGPCPPPTHCSDAKKKKMTKTKKKRATHDGMEEARRFKKRAKNSMDED